MYYKVISFKGQVKTKLVERKFCVLLHLTGTLKGNIKPHDKWWIQTQMQNQTMEITSLFIRYLWSYSVPCEWNAAEFRSSFLNYQGVFQSNHSLTALKCRGSSVFASSSIGFILSSFISTECWHLSNITSRLSLSGFWPLSSNLKCPFHRSSLL